MDDVLSWVRGYNLVIREWGNGALYPLCLAVVVILLLHLRRARMIDPTGWRRERGMDVALALLYVFLFDGLRAFAAWVPLDALNDGRDLPAVVEDAVSVLFTVGVVCLVLIVLRCIWLFAPPPSRNKYFVLAVSTASAAATIAVLNYIF